MTDQLNDPIADFALPISSESTPPPPEGTKFGKAHHILLSFCGLALIVWLLSGFYTVKADEVVIIERLGVYVSTPQGKAALVEHGLQYHIPWPIDIVHRIPVQRATTLVVKTFNESPDSNADFIRALKVEHWPPALISAIFDPYLITGDKNVVHMQIAVTYRIDDPEEWLNTISYNPNPTPGTEDERDVFLRKLIEHAMIAQVATIQIDHILSEGSDRLPPLLSQAISNYFELPDPSDPTGKARIAMGVRVEKVDVVAAHPPQMVQPAFDLVAQARSNRESMRLNGLATANAATNAAEADKANMKQLAMAYKSATIDAAKGEAARFSQIYAQYTLAPDITMYSVYLDAVESVQGNATRMMFAQPGQHLWITINPPQFDAGQTAPRP